MILHSLCYLIVLSSGNTRSQSSYVSQHQICSIVRKLMSLKAICDKYNLLKLSNLNVQIQVNAIFFINEILLMTGHWTGPANMSGKGYKIPPQ